MAFFSFFRKGWAVVALCGLALSLNACSHKHENSGLPLTQVSVSTPNGLHTFKVEVASDEPSREHGLMNRKHLDEDAGMLFVYPKSQMIAFWMKNTPLPLDMLYIRDDGTIATVIDSAEPYSTRPIPSLEPIRAVLELNGGRAEALGIESGDHVYGSIFPKAGDKK